MNNYLVDVAVQTTIWIRPELQAMQFEVIKKARPKILFIQSDGGRNKEEWDRIYESRKMFEESIDWDCTVYKIYSDKNNGLYSMYSKMLNFVWSKVDSCIFMEDDIVPSVSFFSFCKEMLERYKDDMRVFGISGYNILGEYGDDKYDYFFCGMPSSWGYATWRHKDMIMYNYKAYFEDQYVLKLMKLLLSKSHYRQALDCKENGEVNNHPPGPEFVKNISRATQNALFIIPRKNMISNYGCTSNSAHASKLNNMTKEEQSLFKSKTYEIETIKHPHFVIRDLFYEKKYTELIGGTKCKRIYRRVAKGIILIRTFQFYLLFKKIKNMIYCIKEK